MQKLKISELKKVESSNLDLIGFDGDKTFIQFKNGKLYEYPNTTKEEFDTLVNAESVGKEFFKSYKKKEEFTLLENTVLEEKKKELNILESVTEAINDHMKNGRGVEAGALKMFKAALIENSKAKKPLKESEVANRYFKSLFKQQDEYVRVGADTQMIALELKLVEPFTPKTPKPLTDEEVKAAVAQYVGDKGFTQKDTGAIMRVMLNALGKQNGKLLAKYVKEALNV